MKRKSTKRKSNAQSIRRRPGRAAKQEKKKYFRAGTCK